MMFWLQAASRVERLLRCSQFNACHWTALTYSYLYGLWLAESQLWFKEHGNAEDCLRFSDLGIKDWSRQFCFKICVFVCMYEYECVYAHACVRERIGVPCVAMLTEARAVSYSQNWSYRWSWATIWMLDTRLRPSPRATTALNHWISLQPQTFVFVCLKELRRFCIGITIQLVTPVSLPNSVCVCDCVCMCACMCLCLCVYTFTCAQLGVYVFWPKVFVR